MNIKGESFDEYTKILEQSFNLVNK